MQCLTPAAVQPGGPTRTLFIIGDSHAGAMHPALTAVTSGRMRMAFAGAVRSTWDNGGDGGGDDDDDRRRLQDNSWIQMTMAGLSANMRRGDALCLVFRDFSAASGQLDNTWGGHISDWLRHNMFPTLPAGTSVVLLGDNPRLSNQPTLCHSNHALCSGQYNGAQDQQLQVFAAAIRERIQTINVNVFIQTPLWRVPAGRHFWGNVPGTNTNAYWDNNHLLESGTSYLVPYLCSQFQEWGLF